MKWFEQFVEFAIWKFIEFPRETSHPSFAYGAKIVENLLFIARYAYW